MSDEPILFQNTMQITEGHLDGFRQAIQSAIEFVGQHGPQDMVQVFIDEEQMIAHSFQLYGNSEAILKHWELSDPYIQGVMEHCTVKEFTVYGQPSDAVMDGMTGGDIEFDFTMVPRFTGFSRLPGAKT
ncbi:hypothetical protein [Arthrobacter celericrescens]|uniref:hypothetical protein n=1 Tax=Arthrobacter celericrescens TaxID=2320851 RepID=UPI000EA34498|nr:hypothetical protein [Arthrobacter celericrescens]